MPSVGADQLAAMISHAVAPAFMLNAVLATIAILVNRISGVERLRRIREIDESDARVWLKREIVELRQRERLLNNALHLVVLAGIGVFLLLLFGFTVAFMGYSTNREPPLVDRGSLLSGGVTLPPPAGHEAQPA
jgi:hypothetical protein